MIIFGQIDHLFCKTPNILKSLNLTPFLVLSIIPMANIFINRIHIFLKISKRFEFGLLKSELVDNGIEKPIIHKNHGNTKSAKVIP